ncbi:1-acyl-sn-glycerol-3-phosphate acyltransferase [Antarcticirhabdus aurantiaca]|uniref:1-acyl-sn-glycerol-3-phosphate acyltransferase n=1 Tax=Antarcticirhabdus aurantiaca TaxID=2606717 RepID=A0ACD4NR04_9HYPH|nr:1-acyl-sn-glycerol-3-phosphate acyltransferase [Antarcticirhabdus aurantiaca]WAJ29132.1 1-acyl-sn-glycerol-3-phosphate acyltransferase [Jeongeuplla avenae]
MHYPELTYARPNDRLIRRVVIRSMEAAAGRRKLARLYGVWRQRAAEAPGWEFRSMLDLMRIRLDVGGAWPVPRPVPERLIIVANHPFGIGDGVALLALAESLGRPFRILIANDLMKVREMAAYGLPVSFQETREAQALNLATRREAMRLLAEGTTIIVFPAGGVATANRMFGAAEDLPWKQFTARLVRAGRAAVLPVHVRGQNGPLFHLVSKWSQTMRYGLLIGAFAKLYGRSIRLTVGEVIPAPEADVLPDGRQLTESLRAAVLALA